MAAWLCLPQQRGGRCEQGLAAAPGLGGPAIHAPGQHTGGRRRWSARTVARTMAACAPKCLVLFSSPQGQVNTFGAANGFGWTRGVSQNELLAAGTRSSAARLRAGAFGTGGSTLTASVAAITDLPQVCAGARRVRLQEQVRCTPGWHGPGKHGVRATTTNTRAVVRGQGQGRLPEGGGRQAAAGGRRPAGRRLRAACAAAASTRAAPLLRRPPHQHCHSSRQATTPSKRRRGRRDRRPPDACAASAPAQRRLHQPAWPLSPPAFVQLQNS